MEYSIGIPMREQEKLKKLLILKKHKPLKLTRLTLKNSILYTRKNVTECNAFMKMKQTNGLIV